MPKVKSVYDATFRLANQKAKDDQKRYNLGLIMISTGTPRAARVVAQAEADA